MGAARGAATTFLSVCLHKLTGRIYYRLGRLRRASRHFERVLEQKGDDFTAYVYLGRIAYSLGDYTGWRRECEYARRTSPERYSRLKHPFELFEPRTTGRLFEEAGERATWRAFRTSAVGGGTAGIRPTPFRPRDEFGADPWGGLAARETIDEIPDLVGSGPQRASDDFTSAAEREKFRSQRPIDATDIAAVDLDDLARRFD